MIDPSKIIDLTQEFNPEEALKESIVKHDENIEQAETLIWINESGEWRAICTRGNISTILDKLKGRRISEKIVIFDTEQGRYRSQRVLLRVIKLAGLFKNFEVLSLRKYNFSERMQIIQKYFEKNKVAFAVIDGVRDLLADFNNLEQSNELVTELMRISEVYNCHLCVVLHMNKGDNNARGHLGTEITNKAETILSVNKERGSTFSEVVPEYMRDEEFEPFQFTVKDGLPVVLGCENMIVDGKLIDEIQAIDMNRNIEPNTNFDQETNETPF